MSSNKERKINQILNPFIQFMNTLNDYERRWVLEKLNDNFCIQCGGFGIEYFEPCKHNKADI